MKLKDPQQCSLDPTIILHVGPDGSNPSSYMLVL